jgi:hypothetical protein
VCRGDLVGTAVRVSPPLVGPAVRTGRVLDGADASTRRAVVMDALTELVAKQACTDLVTRYALVFLRTPVRV